MDLVLSVCDDYLLDFVWERLPSLPQSLLPPSFTDSGNATGTLLRSPVFASSFGSFSLSSGLQSITFLPRPNVSADAVMFSSVAPKLVSAWPRDYVPRQAVSLFSLTLLGFLVLYFVSAGLSYRYLFDHNVMKHPKFLKNQIRQEIQCTISNAPAMAALMTPFFVAETRGHSKLYDNVDQYGWAYLLFSIPFFLAVTDLCIYFVHRALHHRSVYKHFHKVHHKWIIPTPWASHAFHPIDGWLHSLPYHLFVFVFPMHRLTYLGLFVAVNLWTILIHDSDMITGHPLEKIVNGPAHHTLHHMYFTVNYGQYLTWADRVGGSYRHPVPGDDPLLDIPSSDLAKNKAASVGPSEKRKMSAERSQTVDETRRE